MARPKRPDDGIEQFFSATEFQEMSDYEKLRLRNMKANYEMMVEIGLTIPKPEFMNGPFRKRKPKFVESDNDDEEWKPGSSADKTNRKTVYKRKKTFTVPLKGTQQQSTSVNLMAKTSSSSHTSPPEQPEQEAKQREGEDNFDFLGRVTISDSGKLIPCGTQNPEPPKRQPAKRKRVVDTSQRKEQRYPRRAAAKKCYKDLDGPNDDSFVYCEDCHELFENSCPQHPLTVIENTPVTKGCRDHAKRSLPDGLIVKEAGIKNAGLGVWAEKAFPKGVRFGHYGGEIVGEEEGRESGYAWEIFDHNGKSHYIDGKNPSKGNWMRYVNCACNEAEQNLVAYQYCGQIYYRSFKTISPGQELLVFYGEEYASELGIVMTENDGKQCAKNDLHPCTRCDKIYTDFKYLAGHMKYSHGSSTEWYDYLKSTKHSFNITACNRKVASQVQSSFRNMKVPFGCNTNTKFMKISSNVTELQQFACSQCSTKFNSINDLEAHGLTHINEDE
ncbi:histone-lysine N-methyltransferase PRDM9-like [Asterias rubens]|uniref:histone-lysine N-methyltransferase PRDM9-like n=1 Tax=Asterias rubens TaxID=7604 RepID=UPI0014558927|nr:histone-lysine N-methyltransferase PRDM9-like [Asterias rubens]